MSDWLKSARVETTSDSRALRVSAVPPGADASIERAYPLGEAAHSDWLDAWAAVARDFGARTPLARSPRDPVVCEAPLRPVLTDNLDPRQLSGYGDPAVVRESLPGGVYRWWLHATSNSAPDAFPILSSDDLERWTFRGFVFPEGSAPPWCLTGEGRADFWAPELHRVGEAWWLVYCARGHDREMAIGVAIADNPAGPYRAGREPLVGHGVIDAHLVIDPVDGAPWLLWKEDSNAIWPRRLAAVFAGRPDLIDRLFADDADRRSARLSTAVLAATPELESMQEFFALQPLIEAAAEDVPDFRRRLAALAADESLDSTTRADLETARAATETKVLARRIAPDGSALLGETRTVLVNDQLWEAHLIEGAFVAELGGRWWIVYAANDFSTDRYGIGVGVADHPLGPYEKAAEPLLRSTAEWSGPGHPSITLDSEDRPRLFLHAFFPGRVGYDVFRALLTCGLEVRDGRLALT